ncbi:hypothetical protein [Arthrobacter cheniae]|nr:hypothetical protein [Arthrobacter cheniae]
MPIQGDHASAREQGLASSWKFDTSSSNFNAGGELGIAAEILADAIHRNI